MIHRLTPLLLLLATTPAAAEPLSPADAVAAALSANPAVKKSLQEQARLRGGRRSIPQLGAGFH